MTAFEARKTGCSIRRKAWDNGAVWKTGGSFILADEDLFADDWEIVHDKKVTINFDELKSAFGSAAEKRSAFIDPSIVEAVAFELGLVN